MAARRCEAGITVIAAFKGSSRRTSSAAAPDVIGSKIEANLTASGRSPTGSRPAARLSFDVVSDRGLYRAQR
jgi:hypothetical protein